MYCTTRPKLLVSSTQLHSTMFDELGHIYLQLFYYKRTYIDKPIEKIGQNGTLLSPGRKFYHY